MAFNTIKWIFIFKKILYYFGNIYFFVFFNVHQYGNNFLYLRTASSAPADFPLLLRYPDKTTVVF